MVTMNEQVIRFVVVGDPVAKPRMTRSDKWKRRPAVLRYREYCDRVRAEVLKQIPVPPAVMIRRMVINFHLAMPPAWSKKKRREYIEQPHRSKPDIDNLVKGVLDCLFDDDAGIYDIHATKTWNDVPGTFVSIFL